MEIGPFVDYLTQSEELESRLFEHLRVIVELLLHQERDRDQGLTPSWRGAMLTELELTLPEIRALQDLPSPPSLQPLGHLSTRFAGNMLQCVTALQVLREPGSDLTDEMLARVSSCLAAVKTLSEKEIGFLQRDLDWQP